MPLLFPFAAGSAGRPGRQPRHKADGIWRAGPPPFCPDRRRAGICAASDTGGAGSPAFAKSLPLILVIDDDEMVRIVLRQILERAGYRVVLAAGGRAGMALAAAQAPDLIITDITMPELDGLDVIRSLAGAENTPPIIAISGGARLGDQDSLGSALALGATAVCEKPFDPDDMVTLVRAHVGDPARDPQ